MEILSIGNSFSEDAHRYLHSIARADGEKLRTTNLYIGGCSLERHYRNMLSGQKAYELGVNGENTGFFVSLKEALLNRSWDVVTLQQVSHEAPCYEAYQPYLGKIAEFVRECVPKTKIALHQTWAYEDNSYRLNTVLGYDNSKAMLNDIKASCDKAAKAVDADFVIPSGALMSRLSESGIERVHRDTFHASIGLGRYALGLLWYAVLYGKNIDNVEFSDFDELIEEKQLAAARKCVAEVCGEYDIKLER